jgi:hypothetical protein
VRELVFQNHVKLGIRDLLEDASGDEKARLPDAGQCHQWKTRVHLQNPE